MRNLALLFVSVVLFSCTAEKPQEGGMLTPCDYYKAYSNISKDERHIKYYTDAAFKNPLTGCYCERQPESRQVHHKMLITDGVYSAVYNFQTENDPATITAGGIDTNKLGMLIGSTIVYDKDVEHQEWFYDDGTLSYSGDSKNRKKLGVHKEFNEAGILIKERDYNYENPIPIPQEYYNQDTYENRVMYEKSFDEKGILKTEGAYSKVTNPELAEKIPRWYKDGFSRYHSDDGTNTVWIKESKHTWYNQSGKVDSISLFKKGVKQESK